MILVLGATGSIGRHVVAGLRAAGHDVRAASRSGETPVDLSSPETVARATAGADAAFLLWPYLHGDGAAAVVDALDVPRIVYLSALNASSGGVWGEIEALVRKTGRGWTFLRSSGLATNTLAWAPAIRAGRPVRLPYAQAARSLVHERDLAEVAVLALSGGHDGQAYELTGPATVTQAEQVRILGEVAARPATVVEISAEEAAQDMLTWADPSFVRSSLAYWKSLTTTPELVTGTVRQLTGHPARSFAEWARDHAADYAQ